MPFFIRFPVHLYRHLLAYVQPRAEYLVLSHFPQGGAYIEQNAIPKDLSAFSNWACFRFEPDKKTDKLKKVPIHPHSGYKASAVNPQTWGTLEQALAGMERYQLSGIGFVFTAESGIVGIDPDHCLENLKPNDIAVDILSHLPPTYIEISPSGTGLHIFLRGCLPEDGNRNSKKNVEMYSTGRFFTITGKPFEKSSDYIGEDNGVIQYIHDLYVKNQEKIKSQQRFNTVQTLPDSEILKIAEKSKDSEAFSELFKGEWQGKYASQSEADYALCRKLAFWTARNEAQMHRLFRQSGLMREKWEERHFAGGLTYGETTVMNACKATAQIYTPPNQRRESEIFEQGGAYYRRKGEKFLTVIQRYINISVLDRAMLNELIEWIDVHTGEGKRDKRKQLIEIHWRFLGMVDKVVCQKETQGAPCKF